MEDNSLFDETFNNIDRNKKNRELGKYNSIPFGIKGLDRHLPGIMRGIVYCITAASGIGKTQLAKFLFVLQAYKFVKDHPELNIKLKIIYFALEESREEFMINLICNRLKEKYGITISALQIRSMGDHILSDEILGYIAECKEYFDDMVKYLHIVDNIYNPTGMYRYCRDYATANGVHYYRPLTKKDPLDNELISHIELAKLSAKQKEEYCYYKYTPNDPEEFILVSSDHISLTEPESGSPTKHEAMSKWSTDYARKILAKRFNYCVVQIHQQEMSGDKQQFSFSGDSIVNKLLPALDKLGDNKIIGRDYYIVLGLFAPERYQIPEYLGYDINKLKDAFRSIHILKNRLGTPNLVLPVYFNGANNTFVELPKPDSEEIKRIYTALESSRRSN